MARVGRVFCGGKLAGRVEETTEGYRFTYDREYLNDPVSTSISLTMEKRSEPYVSSHLFAFFYGLLAEGILKQTQCRLLKIDEDDHFGRLLKTSGSDTIGDVTIVEEAEA